MSGYVAKEPDEARTKLVDILRKQRAEAVDRTMVARLEAERRLHAIDQRMDQLSAMKAMLIDQLGMST
jgi:hypothetical protein